MIRRIAVCHVESHSVEFLINIVVLAFLLEVGFMSSFVLRQYQVGDQVHVFF